MNLENYSLRHFVTRAAASDERLIMHEIRSRQDGTVVGLVICALDPQMCESLSATVRNHQAALPGVER